MLTSLHLNIFRKYDPKVLKARYIIIIIFSLLAILASFQLSVDKIHLAENPDLKLACSINSVLNCASVMKTSQAELFGFPNSYLGLMGFPVFLFFAITSLMGTRYSKTILRVLLAGIASAFIFALWLFYESMYIIQILCPWCLLTTTSTAFIFAALSHISLRENIFNLSKYQYKKVTHWLDASYDKAFFISILVIMIMLVIAKFGDSLLG